MKKLSDSKALEEVRAWKNEAAQEVANLPLREALKARIRGSAKASERAGVGKTKQNSTR